MPTEHGRLCVVLFGVDPSEFASPELTEGPVEAGLVGVEGVRGLLTDAARCLALGASLSNRTDSFSGIEGDIRQLGVESFPTANTWDERSDALDASDVLLRSAGIWATIQGYESSDAPSRPDAELQHARSELWDRFRSEGSASTAYAWLRAMATSPDMVISTSANAAMSHWIARKGSVVPAALQSARLRTREAREASDPLASAIAEAATRRPLGRYRDNSSPQRSGGSNADRLSTVIHGTNAWAGDWWLPKGDFFEYIISNVRTNIYARGDRFSWSGRYSKKHRDLAAEKFAEWCRAKRAIPLDVLFGHSYGGCIALGSTAYGVEAETVVLLSSPNHLGEVEWRNIGRCVSLRIHIDLILLANRKPQYFRTNVEEHYLPRWFVRHGDSHSSTWWKDGDWPRTLKLVKKG